MDALIMADSWIHPCAPCQSGKAEGKLGLIKLPPILHTMEERMNIRKKSRQRTELIRAALKDGALDNKDVFNHIIKRIDGTVVSDLWGSYHRLSTYLELMEKEDLLEELR